jgi:hypothetical protein
VSADAPKRVVKQRVSSVTREARVPLFEAYPSGRISSVKSIRLYDWEDKLKRRAVLELQVSATQNLTRNGTQRVYVWTAGDETNFTLYPDQGTAYPEFEERLQRQRNGRVYLYDALD